MSDNVQALALERKQKQESLLLEQKSFSLQKLSEMFGQKEEMLIVLQKTVAKDTTPAEFAYFLSVCKESGLNPINKEIWCYKDSRNNVIVFTGRDGFLKKNKENPLYRGMRSSEVCEFDEFEIDMIESKVSHKITNNRGKVIGAYAIISIEGQKDTVVYLDFDEFNLNQAKWKTSPKMMIKKCAQSHALKEACGMSGIQAEEAFGVKEGVVFTATEVVEPPVNKEEERLELLINKCESVEVLKKLASHCTTPAQVEMYDNKMNELNNK